MKLYPYAGSKQQLAPMVASIFRREPMRLRYAEPFFGSGAVFFEMLPRHAYLADANPHIANLLLEIRNNPDRFAACLEAIDPTLFETHRDCFKYGDDRRGDAWHAAHFFFLLWTCFNGVVKYGADGMLRVYRGTRLETWKADLPHYQELVHSASERLQGTTIAYADYSATPQCCDLFIDPPWFESEENYGVTFDHERLAAWLKGYDGRWLLTINDHDGAGVYKDVAAWSMPLSPYYSVAPVDVGRGLKKELLLASWRPAMYGGTDGTETDREGGQRNVWPAVLDGSGG